MTTTLLALSTFFSGGSPRDEYGAAFSARDFDGDGLGDLLAASPGEQSDEGRVELLIDPGGLDADGGTLDGDAAGDRFGASVALAGDVDGDGLGDVVVGAPRALGGAGFATVYLTDPNGLAGTTAGTVSGETLGSSLGWSVSGAGDTDADGYADVAIGAPGWDTSTGAAYLYLGGPAGISLFDRWTGNTPYEERGWSVGAAGDVDQDGLADFLVGSPGFSSGRGRVTLVGDDGAILVDVRGAQPNDLLGNAVAGLGDVDADGFPDWAAGAPETSGSPDPGHVLVFSGMAGPQSNVPAATIDGEAPGDAFGSAVAGGDLDGDGYADLLAGAPNHAGTGRAYILDGSWDGVVATHADVLDGTAAGGLLGASIGSTDLDGNGADDLLAGQPADDAGKILVVDRDLRVALAVDELSASGGYTLVATRAPVGSKVAFLAGRGGPAHGPCPPSLAGGCVDVAQPKLLGRATADASGEAVLSGSLPPAATPGTTLTLQAVVDADTSAPVTAPIAP